jgi:arsenate reductase
LKKVLFLCSGNSCRSQMAKATLNARLGDRWKAFSAGTESEGYIHPIAIRVLSEIDIHHEGIPKPVDHFKNMAFDLVITLCDNAAKNYPLWLGKGKWYHINFPDPAKVKGSEEEILAAFRNVRDAISGKVIHFLSQDSKK